MAKLIIMKLLLSIDYEYVLVVLFTKRKLFRIFVVDNNKMV